MIELKDWIEIEAINEETGEPFANMEFKLRFNDGSEISGTLDDNGYARMENILLQDPVLIIGDYIVRLS